MEKPNRWARSRSICLLVALLAGACQSRTTEEDVRSAVTGACPSGVSAWTPWTAYATGALASYSGTVYRCVQAHTALPNWTPDVVPALWQPAPCVPGGGPDLGSPAGPPDLGTGQPDVGGTIEYAPYFYTWGWGNAAYPFTSLVDLQRQTGIHAVTLAFVIAAGASCAVSNDGTTNIIEGQMLSDIRQFVANGGALKVSFGGAAGTYLENACPTAAALEAVLEGLVARTGLSDLDFDVEQWEAMTSAINQKRAQALALLQARRPNVRVSFTLPVMPSGLVDVGATDTVTLVRTTAQAGVRIHHVNLMTMDYGNVPGAMGDLAVQALRSTFSQLRGIFPALSDAGLWSLLGATPMIGQNDVAGETFTLDDARTLIAFAQKMHLGLVSFWAINRDQPCRGGDLGTCSHVNAHSYDFHNLFRALK